jgi:hypothetical protein
MTRTWASVLGASAVLLAGCEGAAGGEDARTTGVDAPGLDAPGLDAAADDAFTPGLDAPGLDAPGLDATAADAFAAGCAHPPPAFDEGISPTRTLHVAVGGTGDGSEAAPFGDLEAAVRAATPGTEILVHAGTHPGGHYVENVHGTATAPIWIRGEEGAVIDAAGAGEVLHVTEASHLVIEGLELRGSSANGLNIDDGGTPETPTHHVVMRDLWVHDVGTGGNNDCIKLSGLDDSMVLDSRIGDCRAGDAIDHVGCHRMLIHGNTIEATPGGGVQMKGGSSDNVIHGNRFLEVAGRAINAGGSTGLEFFRPLDAPFEAARIHVVVNLFERGGADSGAAIAFVGCDACTFVHNTVFEPRTWVARILQESTDARFVPSRNGVFANNLVVFRDADLRTFFNVGGGTAPETFRVSNNLWYALDDPGFTGPVVSDGLPAETGSIFGMDPALELPDHRPCTGGPAHRAAGDFDPVYDQRDGACWPSAPRTIGSLEADSCTL